MDPDARQLTWIAGATEAAGLRTIGRNARAASNRRVEDAAFRRLVALLAGEQPTALELDFWSTLHAFEDLLTMERNRTTRLARTRQKVVRVGVLATLRDWALDSGDTAGFRMLIERDMVELSGEAIVLRHSAAFKDEPNVVAAAKRRLSDHGVDPERFTAD